MSAPGFEFFKSTDVGAPVLNGAAGRLIAVLDWALVGKGGWAKAFSGTNLAAYRSASGNRFYFKVDDTQAATSRVRGYRAMTSITAGTNAFPLVAVSPLAEFSVQKAMTAGATAWSYWGIRTNKYIFLIWYPGDGYSDGLSKAQVVCFGDLPSLCETDAYCTVVYGQQTPSSQGFPVETNLAGPPALMPGSIVGFHFAATPSGGINAPATAMATRPYPIGTTNTTADPDGGKSGRLQLEPFLLYSNEKTSLGTGMGICRARLPNVWHAIGQIPRTGLAFLEEITLSGRTFKLFMNEIHDPTLGVGAPSASGFFALEITDTDNVL